MSFDEYKAVAIAEIQARIHAQIAKGNEEELILKIHPLEQALASVGGKRISRAFVVEKTNDRKVVISKQVSGRVVADPEAYIPESFGDGTYLVGSLAPQHGYTISNHAEERFCLRVSADGDSLSDPSLSRTIRITELEAQLKE